MKVVQSDYFLVIIYSDNRSLPEALNRNTFIDYFTVGERGRFLFTTSE